MKIMLALVFISAAAVSGCKKHCSRIDLLPIDPDFDSHVGAVIFKFELLLEDFIILQEEYNNHLFGNHPGTTEEMYAYMSVCDRQSLKNSYTDTTLLPPERLLPLERLDVLDEKVDDLVDCAWTFERSFSAHYNRYHGVWNCEWAKFYSPVPDSLPPATYIRCVEENLKGVAGFIQSLRLDFEEHMQEHH